MRLIALTPVRRDAWSLAASARAALKWCDALIVCQNGEPDPATTAAIPDDPRVMRFIHPATEWDEADIRRDMLDLGRQMGGTHFALCDADEILSANMAIRAAAETLDPGQCLRLPWLHLWRSLDYYRDDDSSFGRQAYTSVVFRDDPSLTYSPAADGYQFHMRAPANVRPLVVKDRGAGLMHMQHVVWARVTAKQAMYRAVEQLRWGSSRTVKETNRRYRPATDETGLRLAEVPAEWWAGLEDVRALIDVEAEPWQAAELARLIAEHGRERFAGLEIATGGPHGL